MRKTYEFRIEPADDRAVACCRDCTEGKRYIGQLYEEGEETPDGARLSVMPQVVFQDDVGDWVSLPMESLADVVELVGREQ